MQIEPSSMQSVAEIVPIVAPLRRSDDLVLWSLVDNYRSHGGLASSNEIVAQMRPYWRQPISLLANWIMRHRVISFMWRTQIMLPKFQFDLLAMTPHRGVTASALALCDLLDDQGIAAWFVKPNEWLNQAPPINVVVLDPDAAINAARQTRLVVAASRSTTRTPYVVQENRCPDNGFGTSDYRF